MPKFYANRIVVSLSLAALLFLSVFALIADPVQAAEIIYVDKNAQGGNTGTDWINAYTDLQVALSSATTGDEIWVARGVYTPGVNAVDTFQLVDGVAIYGGFSTTETLLVQRNWETNLTILSGDIDGNDGVGPDGVLTNTNNILGINNMHVVNSGGVSSSTILDGFTITAGKADLSSGGGISNIAGSPILRNLIISGNFASAGGGGMSSDGFSHMFGTNPSNPLLINVDFSYNTAVVGGGFSNGSSSTLEFINGRFYKNTATSTGGGLASGRSSVALTDVLFIENRALGSSPSSGGGGLQSDTPNLVMTNVVFAGNSAPKGGGWHNTNRDSGTMVIVNAAFIGNFAEGDNARGGSVFTEGGAPRFINSSFSGNRAVGPNALGGGMYVEHSTGPVSIANSIFWNNSDSSGTGTISATVFSFFENRTAFGSSIIQGSGGSDSWETKFGFDRGGNLDIDPLFVMPVLLGEDPTTVGDLRLQINSPAIDTGNTISFTNATSITTDLGSNLRIQNLVIDMGAYETTPTLTTQYVLTTAISGDGYGSLDSIPSGIDCGITCTASFDSNMVVTLTASPSITSNFTGWSGDCTGAANCVITIDSAKSVTATFDLRRYELTTIITGTGNGVISKTPDAISYTYGTTVTLAATPSITSTFTGWSGGDCTGTADCAVHMDAAKTVMATFERKEYKIYLPLVVR